MSPVYLYAVLDAAPVADPGTGIAGERLRLLDCGDGLVAAAGEMSAAPAIAPEALRAHDAVVRGLAERTAAVLPARFGMIASDEATLRAYLAQAAPGLRDALARVAGCEQMILRVFHDEPIPRDLSAMPAPPSEAPAGEAGPGARYLAERARVQRAEGGVPELAPLRAVLERFVTGERVERHDRPPLVASVYHLVPRGASAEYTSAVEAAARALRDLRVVISGPWAPYAFAPDALE